MSSFLRPRTYVENEYPATADLNILSASIAALLGKTHTYTVLPRARVRSTAPVSLTTSTWSTLTYDTAEVNEGGMWFGETGSALIVPAGFAGRWRVGAAVDIENVACNKAFRLIVNASKVLCERDRPGVGTPVPGRITISSCASLEVGDFIEAEAWHDLGVPINATPGTWSPVLWARFEGTDL